MWRYKEGDYRRCGIIKRGTTEGVALKRGGLQKVWRYKEGDYRGCGVIKRGATEDVAL